MLKFIDLVLGSSDFLVDVNSIFFTTAGPYTGAERHRQTVGTNYGAQRFFHHSRTSGKGQVILTFQGNQSLGQRDPRGVRLVRTNSGSRDLDLGLERPLLYLHVGILSGPRGAQHLQGNRLEGNLSEPGRPAVVDSVRQGDRFGLGPLLLLLGFLVGRLPFVFLLDVVGGDIQSLADDIEEAGEDVVHVGGRFARSLAQGDRF